MSWLDCPYTCIVGGDHLLRGVHDGGDGIPTIFIRAPDDAPDIVFYLHVGHLCEPVRDVCWGAAVGTAALPLKATTPAIEAENLSRSTLPHGRAGGTIG
jgi:hypothetical protein